MRLNKRLLRLLFFAGILLHHCSVFAQEIPDTVRIREVVITVPSPLEEAGMPVRRPDTLLMKKVRSYSLAELLPLATPVYIRTNGRGAPATASFRGTAAAHTQVLWNGLNINSPMRGDRDLSIMPLGFTDELNLLTGGASLRHTSGSLGGTVSLKSRAEWDKQRSLMVDQQMESFGTYTGTLSLGLRRKKLYSRTRVFYDRSQNDFPYTNFGVLPHREERQQNASWRQKGLMQGLYFRPSDRDLIKWDLWYQEAFRNLPQLMSFEGGARKEHQDDRQIHTVAAWESVRGSWRFKARSGFSVTDMKYYLENLSAEYTQFDSRSREYSLQERLFASWKPSGRMMVTAAGYFRWDRVNVKEKIGETGYSEQQGEVALMTSMHAQITKKLSASLLNRAEWFDGVFVPLVPSLGIEYSITPEDVFRLNLARNYRKPSLNDRYWIPGGNAGLKPEKGIQAEAEWKHRQQLGRLSLEAGLTGFTAGIQDWIVWRPSANGAYYWEADNLARVFSRGMETRVLLQGMLIDSLSFYLNVQYSFTRTSNLNAPGSADKNRKRQLIYIPVHHGGVSARLELFRWNVMASLEYTGKRYTTSGNEASDWEHVLNPYALLDLRLGRSISLSGHAFALSFGVKNLTDTDYMTVLWRAMPGRHFTFNLTYQWAK